MDKLRTGRVLITGGSSGIGYELAKLFAQEGYHLVLVARNEAELSRVAGDLEKNYGVAVRLLPIDLSQLEAAEKIYQTLRQESMVVDILVNNAGFGIHGAFANTDLSIELQMMRVNMGALTHLTKLFIKDMVKRGKGRILNVASTAAFQPGPFMAVYYATKAYVLSFSEALANELRGTGVSVTTLCPGPTWTNFQHRAKMNRSRLFSFGAMDAAQVAKAGYSALMKNKTVVIPGFKNKFLAQLTRITPRNLVTSIVRFMNTSK